MSRLFVVIITIVVLIISLNITLFKSTLAKLFVSTTSATNNITTAANSTTMSSLATLFDSSKPKTPLYFFSHGGPTFMYEETAGAYKKTKSIGKKILGDIKPNFILVVSAHWEAGSQNSVEISLPNKENQLGQLENKLIYDFYGFPSHMYKEEFHTKCDISLVKHVQQTLTEGGINAKIAKGRGIDHGVWVPFKVAFSTHKPSENYYDLDMPLVQISLGSQSGDFEFHTKLGRLLDQYRELGGMVITSGMSVHNLRDLGRAYMNNMKPFPYVPKFNKLLTSIVTESTGAERLQKFNELKLTDLLYQAHPTLEHFVPIVVASGANDQVKAKELFNFDEGSLGWGIYQFD
ncbi:hypothetical protein WICPIJ_008464 [Wickerhamomyces pijperi]|uniref:Extradiol ring-cleavage dioxygenase class III enzyme subunit B domain-containing protein n=1 Tax=Wickerhamomyces pijperi TaxID=599730 RepID=A0A9P8PX85_WICPI|nr:hypothetical protein WICPIJ_008464 [Wickerhamomyces pijperi]